VGKSASKVFWRWGFAGTPRVAMLDADLPGYLLTPSDPSAVEEVLARSQDVTGKYPGLAHQKVKAISTQNVARVSKPAVSPISQSAGRDYAPRPQV
jgi:hypothetical protein